MVLEKYSVAERDVGSVWESLRTDATAQLVDVRTRAEWTYVGLPHLAEIGKEPVLIEWQSFPDNRPDPNFSTELDIRLKESGLAKTANLFFICRSGARSLSAARSMAALGYSHCYNVTDGFEGPVSTLDDHRHRGLTAGWKFAKLPWIQG